MSLNKSKLSGQKLVRLIPRAKVAFYLGCCTRSVKRMEQRGLLTAHVINSRTTSYPEHEVIKLIADARTSAEGIAA
jgi:hypothetical protein